MKKVILELIDELRDWQNQWDSFPAHTTANPNPTFIVSSPNSSSAGTSVKFPPNVEELAQMLSQKYNVTKINADLTFGQAIEALKKGARVTREGWNGKGMWIALGEGNPALETEKFWNPHTRAFAEQNGGTAEVLPYIIFKTADGKILMGWLASQTDILANDWMIAD